MVLTRTFNGKGAGSHLARSFTVQSLGVIHGVDVDGAACDSFQFVWNRIFFLL